MKKLFVFVLISILSTGQLSWAQNVLCNMDMMLMTAQMTAEQNMMDHSEMDHSEYMTMMESMTIDSQDCCGDNCPCPQAAFSGIALMDNLHKDFPPFCLNAFV